MRGDSEVCFVVEHQNEGNYHLLKGYQCNETFQFLCEFETKRKLHGKIFECLEK